MKRELNGYGSRGEKCKVPTQIMQSFVLNSTINFNSTCLALVRSKLSPLLCVFFVKISSETSSSPKLFSQSLEMSSHSRLWRRGKSREKQGENGRERRRKKSFTRMWKIIFIFPELRIMFSLFSRQKSRTVSNFFSPPLDCWERTFHLFSPIPHLCLVCWLDSFPHKFWEFSAHSHTLLDIKVDTFAVHKLNYQNAINWKLSKGIKTCSLCGVACAIVVVVFLSLDISPRPVTLGALVPSFYSDKEDERYYSLSRSSSLRELTWQWDYIFSNAHAHTTETTTTLELLSFPTFLGI